MENYSRVEDIFGMFGQIAPFSDYATQSGWSAAQGSESNRPSSPYKLPFSQVFDALASNKLILIKALWWDTWEASSAPSG